jgi:hypothetical protein
VDARPSVGRIHPASLASLLFAPARPAKHRKYRPHSIQQTLSGLVDFVRCFGEVACANSDRFNNNNKWPAIFQSEQGLARLPLVSPPLFVSHTGHHPPFFGLSAESEWDYSLGGKPTQKPLIFAFP